MKTEDIKKMAQAWKEVQEAAYGKKEKKESSDTQMGTITVKTDAEREARAKAYRDKKAKNEELKGNQHKIDHNKDGKISAADFKGLRKKAKKDQEVEVQTSESKIDEVSNKTLTNYAKASYNDVLKRRANRPAGQGDESDPKIGKRLAMNKLAHKKGAFKEEAEQIDEISKKKVNAYRDASHDAFKKQQQSGKPMTPKQKKRYGYDSKAADMAYNKLTGRARVNATEDVDLSDFTLDELVEFMVSEEFEQLDEVSRNLARSYIRKAMAHKTTGETPKKDRSSGVNLAGKKAYGIGGKAKVSATESVELDEAHKFGKHIEDHNGHPIRKYKDEYLVYAPGHHYIHTSADTLAKARAYAADQKSPAKPKTKAQQDHDDWRDKQKHRIASGEVRKAVMSRRMREEVELDEGIEKMSHARLKWHMNTGVPHGSYSKDEMKAERDRRLMHKDSAAAYKKAKAGLSEATKDHGNMNNGSPAGEGLSPSAKDQLAKKTPAPSDAFDADVVNKKTFDAMRASAKKAPMRTNDNPKGDKNPPKGK